MIFPRIPPGARLAGAGLWRDGTWGSVGCVPLADPTKAKTRLREQTGREATTTERQEYMTENIERIDATVAVPPATAGASGADTGPAENTVYVWVSGVFGGSDLAGSLLTGEGEVLWGHVSSGIWWLKSDLTVSFTDRREALDARYPDGYEVVVYGMDVPIPEWLRDANKAWGKAQGLEVDA